MLIILVKSKHFARACSVLMLEGFAQEAGAILRLWVEAIELIRYLAEQPDRVHEIMEERLPSAGERAKRIGGHFHNLRKYLNENSSHFSFTPASLAHVLNPLTREVATEAPFSIKSLRSNLSMLFAFSYFTAAEAVNAIGVSDTPNEDLAQLLTELRNVGVRVYQIGTAG